MKITSALFFILLLSSFTGDITPKEIKEKAIAIRTELLSGKASIQELKSGSIHCEDYLSPGSHEFMYITKRNENNIIDSVTMFININEGYWSLAFSEIHFKNEKQDHRYGYHINKNGIIVWAYQQELREDKGSKYNSDSTILSAPWYPLIVEINTDSSNVPPPIKIPDKKTLASYNARLKITLEELEKILFKK